MALRADGVAVCPGGGCRPSGAVKRPCFGHDKGDVLYLTINHLKSTRPFTCRHVSEDLKFCRHINCFMLLTALKQSVKKIRNEVKIFRPYELVRFFMLIVVTVPTQITELAAGLYYHYNFPQR